VGTDSCASSPDLNLVDDLRLLHEIAPEVPAEILWEMATIRAARAVRMETELGSLTAGKSADFVTFAADGDVPLARVLESKDQAPTDVWIAGRRVG
jgi:cytosine/adenosine deaminase-related metal-dependent hydrolase